MTVEASQAQDTGAVEGQGQEGAERQEQQGAEPDYTPIFERLDQGMNDLRSDIEQRFAQIQPSEPEQDPLRDQFQDLVENEGASPEEAMAVIEQLAERKAEEKLGPLAEQVRSLRLERQADALFAELPELKEQDKLEKALDQSFQLALNLTGGDAERAEQMANEPALIRAAYLADAQAQRATTETGGAQQQEVDLESAGAAAQGNGEDPDDELRRSIVGAGPGQDNTWLSG